MTFLRLMALFGILALVSACTATETTLQTAADGAVPATAEPVQAATVASGTITIAPVIGAPLSAVSPLSRRLGVGAKERKITLVASSAGTADLTLRGYFSAFVEDGDTSVIYVWDVLDAQGNRVHRIQGTRRSGNAATPAEPWASVQPAVMEAVADDTLNQLALWLNSRSG
jgi:hypothetical protein